VQVLAPAEAWNLPLGQALHTASEVAAKVLLKVPGGHLSQPAAPSLEKWPTGQVAQTALPRLLWCLPAGHGPHEAEPGVAAKWPSRQADEEDDPMAANQPRSGTPLQEAWPGRPSNFPPGQAAHGSPLPANWPPVQGAHANADEAPVVLVDDPAAHAPVHAV
jgi:hypothetical protein